MVSAHPTARPATMTRQHVPRRHPTNPERSPEERARAAADAPPAGARRPTAGDVPGRRTAPPEPAPSEDFHVERTPPPSRRSPTHRAGARATARTAPGSSRAAAERHESMSATPRARGPFGPDDPVGEPAGDPGVPPGVGRGGRPCGARRTITAARARRAAAARADPPAAARHPATAAAALQAPPPGGRAARPRRPARPRGARARADRRRAVSDQRDLPALPRRTQRGGPVTVPAAPTPAGSGRSWSRPG